jgi:hypothetical protein
MALRHPRQPRMLPKLPRRVPRRWGIAGASQPGRPQRYVFFESVICHRTPLGSLK